MNNELRIRIMNRERNSLRVIITILLSSFFFLHSSSPTQAASFDLSVSPPIFQIELTPPATAQAQQTLTLENTGDDSLLLHLQYKAFRPRGDNGELEYLKDGESLGNDPEIFSKIKILDHDQVVSTINLPPKTKREYDLTVSIPKDEPSGDYYFSLLFVSEPSSSLPQSSLSQSSGAVAVNVLLSIGPKTKTTGSIDQFSTDFLQNDGPVAFTVKIKNTSSHFIYPKGQIIISNMFGQTIGKVDLLPVNILSNSTRSLPSKEQFVLTAQQYELRRTNKELSKNENLYSKFIIPDSPVAIWPEEFLLGPYTATLTIALSDEGPLYTRSIHFIGVPVSILGGFAIAILLLLAIAKRLRHRQRG